ncbi:MAG: sodium/solute symporter [Gammaproteobacteria bacterium]|nr:sodium/solute symporter [Gammaproteobacteria bacterium]
MSEIEIIVGVFAIYLILLTAVAVWSSKASSGMDGYFIAGKKLPFWVVAFSTNATGESGWLLLGLTGMAYSVGLHALWVVLGEVIGIALCWFLIARRLKVATDEYDSITVPDYLESRFNDTRHIIRIISVVIIVSMVLIYIAAQMIAAGKAFGEFMQISYVHGVILGAIVTSLYTVIGGYKAVAYTDVVQGVLMLLALILLPIIAFNEAGGWTVVMQSLGSIDPVLVQSFGEKGWSTAGFIAAASFLAIGLPFLGVPQVLVRFMSIDDQASVKKAGFISVACLFVFTFGAVMIGLAGRVLFPELTDPELIMPTLSRELFPPVITGILVVVLLAAIMSTVDSLLILLSSAITRDLVQKILRPQMTDRKLAIIGRLSTLLIGFLAVGIALSENRAIFWMVLFTWSGLGATFSPVVLCSLLWRGVNLKGAIAGMLGGFLVTVSWVLFIKERFYDMYEAIPGFIGGLLIIIMVSIVSRDKSESR